MAHTLTFNSHDQISVKVNGTVVASPYTLQDGDVVTVVAPSDAKWCECIYDDVSYNRDNAGSLSVSNSDIVLNLLTGGGASQ